MKSIAIVLLLLHTHILYAYDNRLVEISTREGVTQKFILIMPDVVDASVILFAGGKGKIKLKGKGVDYRYKSNNFLVRSKELFAKNNMMVAVVDAPSDRYNRNGMWYGFRTSDAHIRDIEEIVDYLKRKKDVPVWLIGTSRGTESAAHIAIHSNKIDGLVLTASLSRPQRKGAQVTAMELDKITIPTLVVAHKKDECFVTPPEDTQKIVSMLSNSKHAQAQLFDGGDSISKPCKGKSYHGFLGIEEKVVEYISAFVQNNS
jgi:pimeloyl-ACP methyl ester carboxylesterase